MIHRLLIGFGVWLLGTFACLGIMQARAASANPIPPYYNSAPPAELQRAAPTAPYKIRPGRQNAKKNALYRAWNAWYSDPYRKTALSGPQEAMRLGLITRLPPPPAARQTAAAAATTTALPAALAKPKSEAEIITESSGGGIGAVGGIGKVGPSTQEP